jgi:hypothetical protein
LVAQTVERLVVQMELPSVVQRAAPKVYWMVVQMELQKADQSAA